MSQAVLARTSKSNTSRTLTVCFYSHLSYWAQIQINISSFKENGLFVLLSNFQSVAFLDLMSGSKADNSLKI